MLIEAGPHRHTSTSGVDLMMDRRLSQEVVDLVLRAIERGGKTPDDVTAVEWLDEGPILLHCLVRVDGRINAPPEYGVVRV